MLNKKPGVYPRFFYLTPLFRFKSFLYSGGRKFFNLDLIFSNILNSFFVFVSILFKFLDYFFQYRFCLIISGCNPLSSFHNFIFIKGLNFCRGKWG